jgi:cysteine desulfurase
VLVAMGVPHHLALGTIRLSLGHDSSAADVDRVAEVMPNVVAKVRKLSGALGRA